MPHFESDVYDSYDPLGDTTHTSTLVHSQSTTRLATPYPRHPSHCGFLWTSADLSHGSTAGLASRFSFLLAPAILTYLLVVGISAHSCDTVLPHGRNDPYTQWHHGCVWNKLLSSGNRGSCLLPICRMCMSCPWGKPYGCDLPRQCSTMKTVSPLYITIVAHSSF